MQFEDSFEVNAPVEKVWSFVTNPHDFTKIIPELISYEVLSEQEFKVQFRVGLGMISGVVNMTFRFEEMEELRRLKVSGKGTGLQSAAELVIELHLHPIENNGRTLVKWNANLQVKGVVVSIGERLLESTTKSKVKEIVEGIHRLLE